MSAGFWYLQNVDLFRFADLPALAPLGEKPLDAGAELLPAADLRCVLVREGELEAVVGEGDEEFILGLLGPGDFLGAAEFGAAADPSAARAVRARRPSRLEILPPDAVAAALGGRAELGPETRGFFGWRWQHRIAPLASLLARRPRARVASQLLASAGTDAVIRLGSTDLARLCALSRETFDFELAAWRQLGAVAGRWRLRIRDAEMLKSAASEVLAPLVAA